MTFIQVANLLFIPVFCVVPAVCTLIMMLNGRFSGHRTMMFAGAFMMHLGIGGFCAMVYFMAPLPHMFDDNFGLLGLPGFQVYSAGSLAGAMLGSIIILYEDTRAMWSPDDDPKDREDLPVNKPDGDKVVNISRAVA